MKSASAPVITAIKTGHVNTVGLVAFAEWNHNAMYHTLVDNTPTEDSAGYDTEMFPIESITETNRPIKSGICKAVVGQATADFKYHTNVPDKRYYVADVDDEYKYWQSPVASTTGGALANTAPQVLYTDDNGALRTVKANKINVCVENSFANPTAFQVQVKTSVGGAWTTVATQADFTFPATGRVALWYNGSAWTTTKNTDNVIDLHAVRLVVTTLNKTGAYFNLIELGLGLELDVSADTSAASSAFSMGENDFITPLGTISSNTGTINLFNDSRTYTNDNPDSILYGLLDKGVKFTVSYRYEDTDNIQDFVLYSDSWDESDAETNVSLVDYTRFFQDTKPRRVLYENIPVQEAIWRLCDLVGFNNYEITTISTDPNAMIDIFWTDAESSIWETFQELSRATQTAIYFDSYGVLQVKTRTAAFNSSSTPVDTLTRDGDATHLPNIISLSDQKQYEANKVKVVYKPAKFSTRNYYVIPYEQVWAPEETVTLRASPLIESMTASDMTVTVSQQNGSTWPFKGIFQIEGEWMTYEGKEYTYNSGGTNTKVVVTSLEEQQKYDDMTQPEDMYLNKYTGKLIITERGAYNTEAVSHNITPTGWRTQRQKNYGSSVTSSGSIFNKEESCVTLTNHGTFNDYVYFNRGTVNDQGFYWLGTRLRIDSGTQAHKTAGIFFNADGGLGTGYFVEVMASAAITGKQRKDTNEVTFYSMKADGSKKKIGGEKLVIKDKSRGDAKTAKKKVDIGAEQPVVLDNYIDFDIVYQPGTNDTVLIYANGKLLMSSVITSASGWKHAQKGLWGLYVRGQSKASFDYAYAIANAGDVIPSTGVQYWDRIDTGYRSNQWMVDWVYQSRQVKKKKRKNTLVTQLYNQRFFDEFGPILHEIRDFDVKFTSDQPVVQSQLYLSNLTQCVPLSYAADNSSARFTLANTSRYNCILSGDDELTAQGQGTIGQKLFVYGRPVLLSDEKTIEKQDDWAIRRRGVIETDYNSKWIQTEGEAQRFADWLIDHWRTSDSTLTVEIFGNPLYELGDVVNVNYRELSGTYYVIAISNSYEGGISTNLTLRKT